MDDELDQEGIDSLGADVPFATDVIADLVFDIATPGIPSPVRRNFVKALARLCSAAIEVPVAYLEGKADERRAETEARIRLIDESANQIAQRMRIDPEYARVAAQKFSQRVIRQQVNLDMITQRTAVELNEGGHFSEQPEETDDTINDDWLNAFEAEAMEKSTEEMQALFGKILAGEIRKPGSFSIRTIKILGSIDQTVASHFVRLCSMSISRQDRSHLVASLGGNASGNALQEYGLNFSALNLLNEYSLIISDYNSWWEFTPCTLFLSQVTRR